MIENTLAKRYATAIFEFSESKNRVKSIYSVLSEMSELYIENSEIRNFITHPLIKTINKKNFLKQLFPTSKEGLNIVFYILDKGRINEIVRITSEFKNLIDIKNKILEVEATFALNISDSQKKKLSSNLEKKIGKKINLVVYTDPSIIGGGILKIGDKVIDASISSQLNSLIRK